MKTVYGSLVVMCLLAVMLCVPNSAVSAGHDAAAILTTLDPGLTMVEDGDDTLYALEGDDPADLEQYAYDEGGEDETYMEEPEDDSDMEPAPEPDDSGPEQGGGEDEEPDAGDEE